jgi:5-methyltetrahydropteroyltriglutamate--homocysteine methyltransferase
MRRSSIDQVSLECIYSKVPVELLRLLEGKDVLLGAIDVASDAIESPEEVAAVIRGAPKHVDARHIHPCTNCGMAPMDRKVAEGKLAALAQGAAIVRHEMRYRG